MNIKEIKEMLALMNENSLVELEIEKDGMRIRLKKTGSGQGDGVGPYIIQKESLVTASALPGQAAAPVAGAPAKPAGKTLEIKAPMVGTFYRSPSPEAPPYAEVGQVVCIIEAMKLMNEIKSEIRGKVAEITVDNAEPVEFGQSMFIIEPV